MEVPGKKEISNFSCKPCEENELRTVADGFCAKCEEYMCSSCFDTHKKWKLNRDHVMSHHDETDSKRECSKDFEKCEQHQGEPIKFYCSQHEQIGCGDCMIIGHRSCKVDYIPDVANEMKVTSESFTNGTEICQEEAKRVLSSVKDNMVQVGDINEKFKQDVNMFRDEIITRVSNMADRILKEAECIKAKDSSSLTKLVEETECLMKDLSLIYETLESKMESPSKLFVCSVSRKPMLDRLTKQLNEIKGRNKIEVYEFKRDINLCRALASSAAQMGSVQKYKEQNLHDQSSEIAAEFAKKVAERLFVPQNQPLLDRQLVCRNIRVDGQFLSYMDTSDVGDVGLYVDKNRMVNGSYFEVEILCVGRRGTIAIGLVPNNYQTNRQPGWEQNSIAYHADDGCLYHEFGRGKEFGPICNAGDKIGCGVVHSKISSLRTQNRLCVRAVFTRNNRKVGEKILHTGPNFNLYAAVGMHSSGEKVRVIPDAKMPCL